MISCVVVVVVVASSSGSSVAQECGASYVRSRRHGCAEEFRGIILQVFASGWVHASSVPFSGTGRNKLKMESKRLRFLLVTSLTERSKFSSPEPKY